MKILVIGEINVDLILRGYRTFPVPGKEIAVEDCVLTLGSASMICAMGLARLRNQVAFAGKTGADLYGDFCIRAMREAGIDVSMVIRDPQAKTGITVSISSCADRALVTYPGATVSLRAEDLPAGIFEGFDHLHISSFFLQEGLRPSVRALFAAARRGGLTTSLDPGYDPSEEWRPDLLDALEEADIFLPNEIELEAVTGASDPMEALSRLQDRRTLTVAKLGCNGALAFDSGSPVRVPAFPVATVDTTGAGDSFNAGFLHAWLARRPLAEALRFGAACGAISTLGLGGTAHQPTLEEALQFLNRCSNASEGRI